MNTLEEKLRNLLVNLQATVCRRHTTIATVAFPPTSQWHAVQSAVYWHVAHVPHGGPSRV